jgi:hypothetical protein
MISPSKEFSLGYEGRTVDFSVQSGTRDALARVGVRDGSRLKSAAYPNIPKVFGGWAASAAYFKGEGDIINIGLGRGPALDIFNGAIKGYKVVR